MTLQEKLIHFQNQAEKDFEEEKTLKNSLRYGAAFAVFMSSTVAAGFSWPFRALIKKVKPKATGTVALSEKNLEDTLAQHELVLLDFWAEWCGPCIMMEDSLEVFQKEHPEIQVGKVNVDLNQKLAKRYKVRGIPHFVLLQQGQEVKRHAGPMTRRELETFIKL